MKDNCEIKIFEADTVKQALKYCLSAGFMPANIRTIWELKQKKKIPIQWYDTRTIFLKGKVRDATFKELKNVNKLYDSRGYLLFLVSDNSGLGGNSFSSNGRFVGVKK